MSKPHWSYSPGISPAAQEDAAREREDEIAADAVFDTFRAAVVDTMLMDLRQRKSETYEAACRRVVERVESVIRRPHGRFGTEHQWAQFADDYGPEQLRRAFVKALAQTDALARLTRYVQAQRLTQTLVDDFFDRLEQYLDDRADVDDGVPNEEAKLLAELRWVRR